MTMEDEDLNGEGAKRSSLIPVHKLATRDPMHDMQLLRDVAIINERVRRELGPRLSKNCRVSDKNNEHEEKDAMNLQSLTSAMALGLVTAVGPAAREAAASPTASEEAPMQAFRQYASVRLSDGTNCVVGAKSDDDGMNQRPHVRLSDGDLIRWAKDLGIPPDFHGGRATHCLKHVDAVYILVQLDTQSQQSLSQTVLQIVRMNFLNGSSEGSKEVDIPGAAGAYTAWVRKGVDNFHSADDAMVINGKYRSLNSDEVRAFSMTVSF